MRLGRASEEINIGQVVRDLEPTLKPVECDEPRCRLTPNCELKSVQGEAMRAFTGVLDAYTLAANRQPPTADRWRSCLESSDVGGISGTAQSGRPLKRA